MRTDTAQAPLARAMAASVTNYDTRLLISRENLRFRLVTAEAIPETNRASVFVGNGKCEQ
jgi:hypothetical protein